MSRKVGLGDTHFDPYIDGDVDFEFFGDSSSGDPIHSDHSKRQISDVYDKNILISVHPSIFDEKDDINSKDLVDKHDPSELKLDIFNGSAVSRRSSTISDDTGTHISGFIKPTASNGTDVSKKPRVMVPEADNLLQVEFISQATDANSLKIPRDDIYAPCTVEGGTCFRKSETNSNRAESYCEFGSSIDLMSDSTIVNEPTVIDMKLLSKAIADLKLQDAQAKLMCERQVHNVERSLSTPRSACSNFMPVARPRKNMTFSNDQVRKIDRENKLLLNKIIQAQKPPRKPPSRQLPPIVASSAINRMREFKKIEAENLIFLKRLQAVKPTKTLSRDHLGGCDTKMCGRSRCENRSRGSLVNSYSSSIDDDSKRKRRMNSSSSLPSWTGTGSESLSTNVSS